MNRPRPSQRPSTSSRSPISRRSSPYRDTSRQSIRTITSDKSRGRQIMSRNHILTQTSMRTHEASLPRELTPEEQFEQACKGFFGGIYRLQAIALFFLFTLMLFTQIVQGLFETALISWGILVGGYSLAILRMICSNSMKREEKHKMMYRFFESVVLLSFIVACDSDNEKSIAISLFSVLLASYLLRMTYSYTINRSDQTDFGNNINKTVLLLRILTLVQGILALVQLSLGRPITWFVVVIPSWIIAIIILLFIFLLFKKVYFTHEINFWKTDVIQKKKTARWIFGNLFTLTLLLLSLPTLVALVCEGYIPESNRPFLGPFALIVLWCLASLIYIQSVRPDAVKFCQELRTILDNDKEAEKQQGIKYVIKVSNTYFKVATEHDIQQLKSQCASTTASTTLSVLGESEIEATLKRRPSDNGKCLVCCKNAADGVFMECGHGGICFECGKEINKERKECHLCRDRIKSLLKMKIRNNKELYYRIVSAVINECETENE